MIYNGIAFTECTTHLMMFDILTIAAGGFLGKTVHLTARASKHLTLRITVDIAKVRLYHP